ERLHAALMPVLLTEHFADQLLPAVSPLRHRGIRVGLPKRANVRISLQQRVVDTRRACKEISPRAGLVGGLEHVRIDEDASQTFDSKPFDKAHAAHVRGEVVDFRRASAGGMAVVRIAAVGTYALDARRAGI